MPTIAQRAREFAGRAGRALLAFSATPPAPGFEPRAADKPRGTPKRFGEDALYGRVTYTAGYSQARYSSYPGTAIEPQQIWNLQLLRNTGYPQLWTELCEQTLERDGHLGGIFDTRRQSVTDKQFRIHPANRDDAVALALAKFVERVVDKIDSFDQSLEDLLSASAYGYSVAENVWAHDRVRLVAPNGQANTLSVRVPRTIEWVPWKCIRFDRDTDEPYLVFRDGESRLEKNKFVFHAAAGTGIIERRGFMGSCAWLSAAKRWSERDWLVYAKLFGIPNIMAKYPDGQEEYEAHRSKYVQFLKDWGEGIPALLPDSLVTEITREPAGRSSDVHGAIIGWANSEMSKRVLGSTLTVEIGNTGAYAAADTHRDAPYMRTRVDARKLAGTLRRDLLRPIVELNAPVLAQAFGCPPEELLDAVPKCSWRIEREMTPRDRQAVYEGAVNELGLEVDEDQYRDEMGLDAPRQGGRRLRGKPIQVGTGGLAPSVEASHEGAPPPPKGGEKPPESPEPVDRDAGAGI